MPSISQKIRNVFSWKTSDTYAFDDDEEHYKKVNKDNVIYSMDFNTHNTVNLTNSFSINLLFVKQKKNTFSIFATLNVYLLSIIFISLSLHIFYTLQSYR